MNMKKNRFFTLAALAAMVLPVSCSKEADVDMPLSGETVPVSLVATSEDAGKVSLDFERPSNVQWADSDVIAVFDGVEKREFTVEEGSNTGATATFYGNAASGATLYAVYPFEAGNSLSGSNLSVTVPASQVIGAGACVDTTAIVSVGVADNGQIAFKQVCGLVKVEITSGGVRKVILGGNALAGTATVGADGSVASVTDAAGSIELSYENGNFPKGTYYAAVLPGTTEAGAFSVQLVGGGGLTWSKSASSAVTIARRQVIGAGEVDSEATFERHITTKEELYAWGEVMGQESGVTVYLDADIDCGSDPWVGMGATFDGTFEGQDHKIYNLVVEFDGDTGFISRLSGSLKNVTFGSADGSSYDHVSCITHNGMSEEDADTHYLGLVGRMVGNGTMEGVVNYASIVAAPTQSRVYLGGLVGLIPGDEHVIMTDCINYGSVTNHSIWAGGQTRMGGIVGQCSGALEAVNIENHGNLTVNNSVTNFVGGLCGDLGHESSITEASNYGMISFIDGGTQKTYIGGCFGSVRGSIIMSVHNYAPISITRNAECWFGGIAGFMESGESALMECINHEGADLEVSSSVNTKRAIMGGIVGGCQYSGSGPFAVSLQDCVNEASITNNGSASDFGGIAGLFDNYLADATVMISNCQNRGAISSEVMDGGTGLTRELRVGGIIGGTDPENEGCDQVIEYCTNRGPVTIKGALKAGASVRFGGIVGNTYCNVIIDQCANLADVGCPNLGSSEAGSAVFYFAGIVGSILDRSSSRHQSITGCVNTGAVYTNRGYNNQYLGGIVGGGGNKDAYPVIDGCRNYGEISSVKTTNTMVGGLCGYTCWTMSNSANFGNVSGGSWNGAVVGDGNAKAVMVDGIEVGEEVEVTGAANAGVKYSGGKKTYKFTTTPSLEKQWFSGWADPAITVTVVDQESWSE